MRKYLFLLVVLLLAESTGAQSTTVTLSVTDTPDSQTWNSGTYQTFFVGAQTPSWPGGAVTITGTVTALSASGTASFSLPDNNTILPSGTQWRIQVCSATLPARCFSSTQTITGASQTVALTPPSPRFSVPIVPQIVSPISAYNDTEILGGWIGFSYYNLVAGLPKSCQAVSLTGIITCITWTSGTTGQFNVKSYGAVGDAKRSSQTVTTNGSSTITDASNSPFLATDIGKKIYCIGSTGIALSTTISTISAFTSTSSISVAPSAGNGNAGASVCVWFTQKDTAAFQSANTAAIAAGLGSYRTGPIKGYNGAVTCPPGGYVVDKPFFVQNSSPLGLAASFLGSGNLSCVLYISPDVSATNSAWMLDSEQNDSGTYSGFTVDCATFVNAVVGQGIRIVNDTRTRLQDIFIRGCGTSGDNTGLINISSTTDSIIDNLFVDNSGLNAGTAEPTLAFINVSQGIHVRHYHTSNPGPNALLISNSCSGPQNGSNRSTLNIGCLFEDTLLDEGGNPTINIVTNGSANFVGLAAFNGAPHIINVDGTSNLFLTDASLTPFNASCGGANDNAISIASGGYVYATGSTIASCGTATAVTGPAGATFVDDGGNLIENCTAGTCTPVTAATYATLGFGGGIVPIAVVQMPSNTCYPVQGNLLATAQNICSFVLTKNQQITSLSAQSGGTTPANSSCTGAPTITLSDGTRTATMVMTTGKTFWTSSVDVNTNIPGQVFASGATLTVSIGANTCATPPSNVSVTYNLQSVLNQ